jgi:hypothetical protein
MQAGTEIVDILFDPKILSPDLMAFHDEFLARRHLTLFRSLYITGHYDKARTFYRTAIKLFPGLLRDGSHLRKYLLTFIKRQTNS